MMVGTMETSAYAHRMHLMVATADATRAGEIAARVLPGGDAERRMFGAAVVPPDDAEGRSPGWLGCSTLLTEEQRASLLRELEAAGIAARWVLMRAEDNRAIGGTEGFEIARDRAWSWEETVGAMGESEAAEL